MGARNLPRPQTGTPTTPAEVVEWLRYLCLNGTCRGLGGHELSACPELIRMDVVLRRARREGVVPADAFRSIVRERFPLSVDGELVPHHRAIWCLLGMTSATIGGGRAFRRAQAASALGVPIDTFQKRLEKLLLYDVAVIFTDQTS